ncbi:MAG TPA: N-acetylmuramoyl-L-alanine amidase [Candidatus Copromorpha excrementigallinarum]|uniref:N-acetylmuramoyl-L-alanine amidase n=1 Tax=Candidatus Allocopromorpha excrementigallinarum TaxID=2840742 RepID=A0A9D1L7F7_9FIRM|nr:N-acetylmuramoyl-L-alanine amidase [Candidatus Copromorpha excrementigallinarum]
MPSIFLSPSVQEYNPYVNGLGSEEYYMNLIADAMEPYLDASGITYVRNNPNDTLLQAIALSNQGDYDFHLALHSNASPESLYGQLQGPDIYYYSGSAPGGRAAEIFAENLRAIYPNPDIVRTIPNTSFAELRLTRAPANLIEIAYHDNYEDAMWIIDNIDPIARNLVLSLTQYFGIPFIDPYR